MTKMKNYPYQNTELKNLQGELWIDIPGFEMYFMVSNYGRIKRLEYEMVYSDGRVYTKPEKIIKPVLMMLYNRFMNDNIYFLRVTITLHKQKNNFSLARLVYNSFEKPINLHDESVVILTKDGDGRNIKHSNLQIASLSEKQKRIFDLKRREPLVVDEEARKIAVANAKLSNNKQVSQYTMLGKKVKTYPSVTIASQETGISHSHISNRARGTEFSAGGFIWRFGNAPSVDIKPMLKLIEQWRNRNKEAFGTKVSQYNMKGRRICVYPTINDAAKATAISKANISSVFSENRFSAGGFYWLKGYGPGKVDLSGYEYGEVLRAKRRQRPIQKYSKDGKPLQKFDSIKEAAANAGVHTSTVIGALRNKHDTAGGYKWKYI